MGREIKKKHEKFGKEVKALKEKLVRKFITLTLAQSLPDVRVSFAKFTTDFFPCFGFCGLSHSAIHFSIAPYSLKSLLPDMQTRLG